MPSTIEHDFTWKFQRLGGIDQATLRTAEELRNLKDLDPKLWATLSCPASGLEFDNRTLQLVDADSDGRIRIPEVIAAVDYVCAHLKDPSAMVEPGEMLPLALLRDDAPECERMHATGKAILEKLGKADAEGLTQADVTEAVAKATENRDNGDGIVPPFDTLEPDLQGFIKDAIAVIGGVEDATGLTGINREIADAFTSTLTGLREWRKSVHCAATPLGADTAEAWCLLQSLKDKIDDYYLRCDLAAFAPASVSEHTAADEGAGTGINCAQDRGLLDIASLADLPISRIEADRPLHISSGLNPAWRERVTHFFTLAAPLLNGKEELARADWQDLQNTFCGYADALSQKPAPASASVSTPAVMLADDLTDERIHEILDSDLAERFAAAADLDASVPAATRDIEQMERLVLYYLHLHRLLMNFVSFYDFYSLRHNASFQSGTLFIDGRGCHLCLPVVDVDKHAALASYSQLCLVYCLCRRIGVPPSDANTKTIVAAVTAGDADLLLDGRNGVYVDNDGSDWDATLVKVITNPISIRQAVWQPYKRLARMLGEQVSKFAASKQDALTNSATQKLDAAATDMTSGKAPAQGFDIGKSVGIFAAVGLALGAIGTAVASIASALLSLTWWQFPLLFIGIFLLISGPSVVLAWLKLRKRTLGPLLEASGWAVNSKVPVNFTLGGALTSLAVLPRNSQRSYIDPLIVPNNKKSIFVTLLVLLLIAGLGAVVWYHKDEINWDWAPGKTLAPELATPPAADAPADKADAPAADKAEAAPADKAGKADKAAAPSADKAAVPPADKADKAETPPADKTNKEEAPKAGDASGGQG